ncbi:hypothetical protein ACJX0J_022920, partial [Zea mays]
QIFGLQIFVWSLEVAAYNLPVHGQQRVTVCLYHFIACRLHVIAIIYWLKVHFIAVYNFGSVYFDPAALLRQILIF